MPFPRPSSIRDFSSTLFFCCFFTTGVCAQDARVEETHVEGVSTALDEWHRDAGSVFLDRDDFTRRNTVNTEDALTYVPHLIVRKRYVGDLNGTLGLGGANMFQTARTLVLADGVPLSNPLQSEFNGAPRWSLVAPEELAHTRVVYGPFDPEFGGRAMGGAVVFDTTTPRSLRAFSFTGHLQEDPSSYRQGGTRPGASLALNVGEGEGDRGWRGTWRHQQSESQILGYATALPSSAPVEALDVAGAREELDALGRRRFVYGDEGTERARTDLVKWTGLARLADWQSRWTVAAERRTRRADDPRSYLENIAGETVWRGQVSPVSGDTFAVDPTAFYLRDQERQTLLAGARFQRNRAGSPWQAIVDVHGFRVLDDEDLESAGNFADPAFSGEAQLVDGSGSGWHGLNLGFSRKAAEGLWRFGLQWNGYQFRLEQFASRFPSAERLEQESEVDADGSLAAGYVDRDWQLSNAWKISTGVRVERWRAEGRQSGGAPDTDRREDAVSPSFRVSFKPASIYGFHYSFARAARFPTLDELFQNERRTTGTVLADRDLEPERGLHHRVAAHWHGAGWQSEWALFYEDIDDVILTQTQLVPRVRTYFAVDRVVTEGLSSAWLHENFASTGVRVEANIQFTRAQIRENSVSSASIGRQFPRTPKWRGDVLLSGLVATHWTWSAGLRVASKSYGRTDNRDQYSGVFGAHDGFTFAHFTLGREWGNGWSSTLGLDNAFAREAYVFSAWPGRTWYLQLNWQQS